METLVLDPAEVAVNRTELVIHEGINPPNALPIWIREDGPSFGDSALTNYMADAERGSLPVDHRFPNREVTIPLVVAADPDAAAFIEARNAIQDKVALFQAEGGWLKREFSDGRVLYLDIVGASLKMGGDSHQARETVDQAIDLTLETIPDWYDDEVTADDHTETTAAEISWVEDGSDGNHPGRVRVVVDNDQSTDQLGLIACCRSKHYSAAATAAMKYEAEALTPLDAAAVVTLSGASGGASNNTIRHNNLGTSWLPVLSTTILSGSAEMTHTGTYRVWARVYSTSPSTTVTVKARFVWDVGDLVLPEENAPVTIPGASAFYLVDLGEIRLDAPPVGTHRWRGIIQAKGSAGAENIYVDKLWFFNTDEFYATVRTPTAEVAGLIAMSARDGFDQTAGALNAKTAPTGGTWATSGDATDLAVETTGKTAQRSEVSDAANTGRYAVLGSTAYSDIAVQVDFKQTKPLVSATLQRSAALARFVDSNNWLLLCFDQEVAVNEISVFKRVGGTVTPLLAQGYGSFVGSTWYTLRLVVTAAGVWSAYFGPQGGTLSLIATGSDPDLATGGALATGKPGFYDENTSATASTRNYDNFLAWVPQTDAAVYASRSIQLTTDGPFRQDSTGASYGPVSASTGNLPRIPSGHVEGRSVEWMVKASRGDLDQGADSGIDDISAQTKRRNSWVYVPDQYGS